MICQFVKYVHEIYHLFSSNHASWSVMFIWTSLAATDDARWRQDKVMRRIWLRRRNAAAVVMVTGVAMLLVAVGLISVTSSRPRPLADVDFANLLPYLERRSAETIDFHTRVSTTVARLCYVCDKPGLSASPPVSTSLPRIVCKRLHMLSNFFFRRVISPSFWSRNSAAESRQ